MSCRCGESKKKEELQLGRKEEKRRAADVEKVRKQKSCRCGESKKKEELQMWRKYEKRRAVDVEKVRKKSSKRNSIQNHRSLFRTKIAIL